MLEGLAAWVLNTYLGEYVENLNTAQLSIALLQGAVELENLPLKKDALKAFDLPIEVKSGFIGKITLQIPIRYMRSQAWVISIEKLYLVAGPYKHTQFDAEKTKKDEQKKKASMLEALEKEWKIQKQEKQEGYGSSWFSYGTSIASNILENLQLKIKDVHIRYEDDQLIPSCPFSFGISIKSLRASSTDGQWEMKFVSHDETNMMHKMIDLQNFSVYLDTHATMLGSLSMSDLADALEREMFVSQRTQNFQDHEFILAPISAQTKLKRNTSALPLRSAHMPRIELDMNLKDITACLSEDQYRCIIQWLKEIERHDKRRKCKRSCPPTPVMKCPGEWWRYAVTVHKDRIREKNEHRTWSFVAKRVHDILLYYKAYTVCLIGEQLNSKSVADKSRIEEEFSFDELRIIRELAYKKVKEVGSLFKMTPVVEKPPTPAEQKGYLQSWFPGWGGWGGSGSQNPTSSSSGTNLAADVGEPPPQKVVKQEELEQEIMEVIQETSENTSFLKKDALFALMHFTLNSGSFKLLCPNPATSLSLNEHPTNVTMVELECSRINMMFESRPRSSGLKYSLSLGSLYLRDKITDNSSFPCLVSPQTRERRLSLSGSFSGGLMSPRALKSADKPTDVKVDMPHHSPSTDSFFKHPITEDKLFELLYEKNPASTDASYKLSINTKPLDLVYNPATVRRVREFFSSRNKGMAKVSKLQLTAQARRRYEVFKEQTKAELRNTLDQILAGDESIKTKKWVVDLDISAPQILIPENFADSAARMVILDLGHLHLYNKQLKPRQDSDVTDDDEFQTPLSTPPSEEEKAEAPSLSQLTEAEIYNKLYDRYTLELSDLQVMVGRARDNWKHARNRGSSHLHVIDKFSINLQFDKRLIYTTDPQYPSTTMTATLPCLTFHVNEHKVSALRNCVNIITQPSYSPDLSASPSSTSFSDSIDLEKTQSKQSPIVGKQSKREEKLKSMDEYSRLMVAALSINMVSLEIQSRGRSIAELQVTKVKADMIKRPYDTSVGLTVHSLLVVDALQTYGHDFELLIASHRGVRLDSKSGSIMGSDPASPTSPTSPLSPRSPAEMVSPPPTSSLQSVQEAISKAFKSFVSGDSPSDKTQSRKSSSTTDVEAIVRVDLEIIGEHSPSNTNGADIKIANIQFSNLDIVANQETMVELMSFVKLITPSTEEVKPQLSPLSSQSAYTSQLSINTTLEQKQSKQSTSRLEITADFQRLNILLMRLESIKGEKQARKVATATMSAAQLQATLGNELDVSGSLGGFHFLDVTPDAGRHYHIFSVGTEETIKSHSDSMPYSVMYKTAHESMFSEECRSKALQFSFMKGVQPSPTIQDFTLDTSQMSDPSGRKLTSVNVQMASMCYIHSPRLLNEVTQCVSEFTDFMKSVASSIKTAASEVAKGILTKKTDVSMFGSTIGIDLTKSNLSINSDDEISEQNERSHILLNAQLDTPVIVFPRSAASSDVLVAHLGHISVKNFDSLSQDLDEEETAPTSKVRMFVEAKDMNLYSLNIDKHIEQYKQYNTDSIFDTSMYRNSDFGLPIVHNTTVEILLEHEQPDPIIINIHDMDDWCFNGQTQRPKSSNAHTKEISSIIDVTACISTPLNVELSQSVYEQILQTTDNLTYNENIHGKLNIATDQSKKLQEEQDQNLNQNKPMSQKPGQKKFSGEETNSESVVKLMFKVPTLNVEMKGEFDEGYKGLVNINLQDFVLNMKKENSFSTHVQVSLKTLIMEDLLENVNSEHRYLLISRQIEDKNKPQEPKLFLSRSCPDSCIIAPVPIMPHSLPSSFHQDLKETESETQWKQNKSTKRSMSTKPEKKSYPCTPPPSMRTSRRGSMEKSTEDDLVHISLTLIDKFSPEYVNKYNKTNRFIDVDFNCLEANVNLQTWVVLLDFLGLGAKIHDEDIIPNVASTAVQKDVPKIDEPVNSVVNLKVKSFSLRLNKPEYELSRAQISQFSSHINTRDGNLAVTGQLGSISLTDQSPHGELYRERFMTVGHQALIFDVFKYGLPDPGLQKEYDIQVKLKMASVRYVHTNRFQSEFVAFLQHFLQLQDVLGRIKAASAGIKVADKAFRGARILLDIEAESPIIVIPHSSLSNDVLVADFGNLSLKNVFKHDGTNGTLSAIYRPVIPESETVKRNMSNDSLLSTDMSQPGSLNMMTESLYNDILPPNAVADPMTSSIYGSLEKDDRTDSNIDDEDDDESVINEFEVYDPTIETPKTTEGSSVDPNFLVDTSSSSSSEYLKRNVRKTDSDSSSQDARFTRNFALDSFLKVNSDGSVSSEGPDYICLLDVMSVVLSDMDLYSAERVDKQQYNRTSISSNQKDLVFTDCVMCRQGGSSLKEKCMLKLQIERNLENDISHAVPDWRINGALSSMHVTIDMNQFKLIKGILDHNLGEKLPEFQKPLMSHLMDPKIHTVLSGTVWQNIGMAIDLNNVTIELVMSHDQGPEFPECSLAKLDFISSTFRFDSFSNQSKDVDLVSHEIVVSDTRYRDAPVNVRPNVFDRILQPVPVKSKKHETSEYGSFQLELHFRSTKDSNQFSILLNNMKLMCVIDWLLTVQEFLTAKPDDPFSQGDDNVVNTDVACEETDIPILPQPGSRTRSPVNISSGVMTKRGPIVEQVEVPFELKLNVSNTQFVVVEDSTTWDTNAVILKSTAVLTYRPSSQDKLLSCSLQSIEMFSCSLLSEDETALSIIDPLMINIDLNANPLPDLSKSSSTGLLEASDLRQKNLVLEVSFNTMNIRLSYLDMKMFLAILNSLPDQALRAKNRESQTVPTKYPSNKMKCLKDFGFSEEDCEKALDETNGNLTEAALWLTTNAKPLPEENKGSKQNLTCIELKASCVCLCFIDDCKDSDVPLAELSFNNINIQQKLHTVMEGQARFSLMGDYYNRELSGWEPFIEPWRCNTEWRQYDQKGDQKRDLQINAPDVLNIDITRTFLDLYNKTKDKWTEDYYKQEQPANSSRQERLSSSSSDVSSPVSNQRRRTPFVPFVLDNQTGCPLWYLKVTTHPSRIKHEMERRNEIIDGGYIQASDWKKVQPGQQVSFEFNRPQKIRHKKTHELHVNQIVVKVDGWHRLSAVSVDKVGVYFREAEPDKKSAMGLNSILYEAWHDPAKQHLSRVVFDVRQEGSARKVITIRSALTITNKIDSAVDIRMMAGNGLDGKFEILPVKPLETIPVPLPFICATLYMKPSDWPVKFCDQPVKWQHVGLAGDIKEKILKCEAPDNSGVFRFCASVHRENYPEQILTREDIPILPGHTITILPPVVIHNLLPIDMRYFLSGTDISGLVKTGQKADLHAADPQNNMNLGIHVENFDRCQELMIPPDANRNNVKLRLTDRKGRKLHLLIKITSRKGGSVNISVLSPFWLINKSGLPLVFGQTDKEAAGQFEEHELARSVTPLLFSFTENDAADMCTMRIGKSVHGPESLPLWCTKFSLDSGVGMRKLNVVPKERNKPDWLVEIQNGAKLRLRLSVSNRQVFNIGIAVQQGRGRYKDTNIVNFAPRFEIDNQSSHKLAIAQRHIAMEEMVGSLEAYLTALPKGKMPFHFPRLDFDQLLCVKMIDKQDCMWSGGFLIDRISSFHVNMRDRLGNAHLLKVEIVLEGPTFHIIFVDAEDFPPPFRIDNHSEVSVMYYQSGLNKPFQKSSIKPKSSLPYAWDEPILAPLMTMYVQGGSRANYNLDKLEEGEQLCYENFIYITATSTFGSDTDGICSDLVLEVVQDNNIVFRRKAIGNRSQLWRMTGAGMLEHEGSMVPRDPRKSSSSTKSLVLDTNVIAPQPGRYVPLTLRKPDNRRTSTQIWEFTQDGRLSCASGILCVQALGGILQEGAIAVSGPGPSKQGHRIADHMKISRQKLRPGSGYLSVRVLMDGPIRVLEIADIQNEHLQRSNIIEESGWQIYEETSIQTKEMESSQQERKILELSMSLKGGLGISLINRVPEELVYISLSNITIDYISTPEKVNVDISVSNIQVDNQLLDAQKPVMLFVTRTSKKDVPDNTPALHIVAYKIPNTKWNADIYKHLIISMKKLNVHIEERLLWKLFQFGGFGQTTVTDESLDEIDYDTRKAIAAVTSVKAKRYYFGTMKINTSRVTLSMCTSKLSTELRTIKTSVTSGILASFEDAKVDLDSFVRHHPFETSAFLTREIIQHFTAGLKSQAAKLLGSVDFLGNPLGLFNDVTEGISGLIKDGNVGGLLKNVTHGVSNSAAKFTGSLSDSLGILNFDEGHNESREQLKTSAAGSRGGHLVAGFKGLALGVWGGLLSIPKQGFEGARVEGVGGAIVGVVKGAAGALPKVATGVLDMASGAANAIKDTSESKHCPPRVRETRCCHGPGGLLPQYSKRQADQQRALHKLTKNKYNDSFIAMEQIRSGARDGLLALITNQQVYFIRPGKLSEDNIIFQVPYREIKHCHTVKSKERHYIELVLSRERSPQIQCDKQYIAQRAVQQINYARNLYDEQRHTVMEYSATDFMD